MFTGLIEEVGTIKNIRNEKNGLKITVNAREILNDIKIDDSVAVNGTCLTVTDFTSNDFTVQAINETVEHTTFKSIYSQKYVNLERAVMASTRLGGHIVQGHIDGIGKISSIDKNGLGINYTVVADKSVLKYIVYKGSIALNGISLTVSFVDDSSFSVSIIPHSVENTTIKFWKIGDLLNIETDILARYIEKFLKISNEPQSSLIDKMKTLGY